MSDEANYAQYGDQTLISGLPEAIKTLIPGMAVTSLKPKWTPEFVDRATGDSGRVTGLLVAEDKIEYEGSGYLIDEDDFRANKTFTESGNLHVFTDKGGTYEAGKFTKCDFKTESYGLVTT